MGQEFEVAQTMLTIREGVQFIAIGIDGKARLFQVVGTPEGPSIQPIGVQA